MLIPRKITSGEQVGVQVLVRLYNELVEAIGPFLRMAGGPGIELNTAGGTVVISAPKEAAQAGGVGTQEVSGDPKVLGQTQGTQDTDTYDRSTDDVPVQFQAISDVQYDATTHKLTFRTRTITAVGITEVSAESDLVEITTAVGCA